MSKAIKCRLCGGEHVPERGWYYCPSVFGGNVRVPPKPQPKVKYVRRCICKRITNRFEWEAALWYGENIIADCMVKSAPSYGFDTEEKAREDMTKVLARFGINKKTKAA